MFMARVIKTMQGNSIDVPILVQDIKLMRSKCKDKLGDLNKIFDNFQKHVEQYKEDKPKKTYKEIQQDMMRL